MTRILFTTVVLVFLTAQVSAAQTPPQQPPSPFDPPPPWILTPAQERALQQLLDAFLGAPVPQPPGPNNSLPTIPTPSPLTPAPGAPFPGPPPAASASQFSPIRFSFKFDPKASATSLLPTAPTMNAKVPRWTNEDLAKVPELTFGTPIAKNLDKMKSLEATAHVLAKVNQLNARKTDGFMLALLDQRPDLRGMPFLMGDECRTREDQAKAFRDMAQLVNSLLAQCKMAPGVPGQSPSNPVTFAEQLWGPMSTVNTGIQRGNLKSMNFQFSSTNADHLNRAMIAALMQILMPESDYYRAELAKFLSTVPHPEAAKALVKLLLYSPEESVRSAAIEGLKTRREKDYTDALLQGFRYPLPAVSKRAAEALVKLDRQDVLAQLVDVLDAPDPRLPATVKREGKELTMVRELVKVNHHHNCALCHAPGNTDNVPAGVLTVAVPLPSEPLPKPSQGGYQSVPPASPDIVVRLDMTYLRQDFSMMMPVADAHPWPELQRFDFLVRTRELTPKETEAYEVGEMEEGRLSPYHRAALYALRELTGRDAEPTAAAWRKLLKIPARQ